MEKGRKTMRGTASPTTGRPSPTKLAGSPAVKGDFLLAALEASDVGIIIADESQLIRFANPASIEMLDSSSEAIDGQNLYELLERRCCCIGANLSVHIERGLNHSLRCDLRGDREAKSTVLIDISLRLAADGQGMIVAVIQDNGAAEKDVVTDPLTRLYNRGHFNHQLPMAFDTLLRRRRDRRRRGAGQRQSDGPPSQLSLLLIDIDHFKQVNDTYGHQVGDSVLREVARIVQVTVRRYDIVARYGGEEIAVILAGADAETARRVAERVRCGVERLKHRDDEVEFSVSVSIGVATQCSETATSASEMLADADRQLYRAKHGGRNRVCQYGD